MVPPTLLAYPVVDLVSKTEELARRPDANLVAVRIDGHRRVAFGREHRDADASLGAVRHLVRAFLTFREADDVARLELLLTCRGPDHGPALEHEQPLLVSALVVVGADALARRQLVNGHAEPRGAEKRTDPQRKAPVALRIAGVRLELELVEVQDLAHSPSQYSTASPRRKLSRS